MGIFDKLCGKLGIGDGDADEEKDSRDREDMKANADEEEEEMAKFEGSPPPTNNVVNFQAASAAVSGANPSLKMRVIVIEPKSFDDAEQVANCLREKKPVIINFENTSGEDAKRIVDFISGTTYALNGEIKKVGQNVFLCAPNNVNVSYSEDRRMVSAEMPWMKK